MPIYYVFPSVAKAHFVLKLGRHGRDNFIRFDTKL